VRLVDHVDAALAADDLAIGMALLERLEGGGDFHGREGRFNNGRSANKVNLRPTVNGISCACLSPR